MKNSFFLIFVILFSVSELKSQYRDVVLYREKWDQQPVFWGYYVGFNAKSFNITYTSDDGFVDIKPKLGFSLGLVGNLRLHKNLSLRLEPGVSSNTKILTFSNLEDDRDRLREVTGTYMRIPLLLKFSTNRLNNIRPHLMAGASYDYNFSSNQNNSKDNYDGEFRMRKHNFSYELGIGIDIYLPYFIFSPSIRGIFAITDELVRDNDPSSPWTGNIDFFGTQGIFLQLTVH